MIDTIPKLTAQLCSYLKGSIKDLPGARVTTGRPRMSVIDLFRPRINIYLLDISENPSLRNQTVPSGNGQKPAVGLNLTYLVSFYGRNTRPHDLAGTTVKAMALRSTFDPSGDGNPASNVHLNLLSLDLKEMHLIWDMIGVRHAPSLIYTVTGLTV
jgi:hypothetical protein